MESSPNDLVQPYEARNGDMPVCFPSSTPSDRRRSPDASRWTAALLVQTDP